MPPWPPGAGAVRPRIEVPSSPISQSTAWLSSNWGRGEAEWLSLAVSSFLIIDLSVRQPPPPALYVDRALHVRCLVDTGGRVTPLAWRKLAQPLVHRLAPELEL